MGSISDNISNLDEFVKVSRDCKDLTFRQIWDIYDKQFELLKDTVKSMGDKFVVEEFLGSGGNVLSLNHTYMQNHTMVYINDVIQWKDTDYFETNSRTITLSTELAPTDIIKVVIILSSMLVNESDLVYTKVEDIVSRRIYDIVYEILKEKGIITDDEVPDDPIGS